MGQGTSKYRKIMRTPQTGENAGKKLWYATAVSDREMSFEDFVTHISEHNSPYSRGTIHGVLMDALDHLQELILDGKSVRLSGLGLFSSGIAFILQNIAQRYTTAPQAAIFLSSEALFAALFGVALLGETITPAGYAGCAIIFVAILAVELVPELLRGRRAGQPLEA